MIALNKLAPIFFLLMWSSGAIFVKLGLEYSSVWVFLAIRATGTTIFMILLLLIVSKVNEKYKNIFLVSFQELLRLIFVSIMLQTLYQSFFFLAINYKLSPTLIAIILGFQPMITPLLSKESLTIKHYIVLFIGFIGLMVAILGSKNIGNFSIIGIIFGIGAVFAISIGSVWQKTIKCNLLTATLYQNLTNALIFLSILPFIDTYVKLTWQLLIASLWMIIVISVGSVLLLFYMIKIHPVSKVTVLFYLVPPITMILDYLVFKEGLSIYSLIGVIIIMLAIKKYQQMQLSITNN